MNNPLVVGKLYHRNPDAIIGSGLWACHFREGRWRISASNDPWLPRVPFTFDDVVLIISLFASGSRGAIGLLKEKPVMLMCTDVLEVV